MSPSRTMVPLLLGVDVGSSSTKAVLVDRAGTEVARAAAPTPFAEVAGGVEAGVDDLLGAVARVLAALGPDLARVEGVGVAGMAESGAALDRHGRPLAPVLAWHDPRGAEVVAAVTGRLGAAALAACLGQPLRTVSSVAKLGWLVGSGGVVGVARWLGVPELCVHALTGVAATDWSLAARTGAFDVVDRVPVADVAAALGLPSDVFLAPTAAGTAVGRVTPVGAAWSGLPAGVPVAVAGHDHLAGVVGAGVAAGELANSVGTAETVVGLPPTLPSVARALALRCAVTLRPDGDGWAVLAGGARAGMVVTAVGRALGRSPAELDGLAAADPIGEVAAAADGAAVVAAAQGGLPPRLPDAPPGAVWLAVLRALAARTADAAAGVAGAWGGPSPAGLVVFGGGSRSRPWLAAKAEAVGMPLRPTGAVEAAARGAALQGGVAAGWWPSATAAPLPPPAV